MKNTRLIAALVPFLLMAPFGAGHAAPAPAEKPGGLAFPLDCTLGKDCWIGRYVDRGVGPTVSDYRCGTRSQDGHAGTDIMVANLGRMQKGVAVLAAKAGQVLRLRDGVPDQSVRNRGQAAVKGEECGNGLVIRHTGGLESQYCHLKNGSLKVKVGDWVKTGQQVAELGLSGETEYPHVHYMIRKDGKVIDPFDGGSFQGGCRVVAKSLWADKIAYEPSVLLPLQLSDHARSRQDIWDAPVAEISAHSPALVLLARGFHVRKGDHWHLAIFDPRGGLFLEQDLVMPADKQFYYQFIGRKLKGRSLLPGLWSGVLTLSGPSAEAGQKPTKIRTHILVRKD